MVGGVVCDELGSARRLASRAATAAVLVAAWLAPNSTESAVANGDTRTVVFSNQHTNEQGSFTYMVNGVYDQSVLDKLNWFMRDWRLNEPTKMDPRLFDIVWEVYREFGSREPIDVLSGYRSPQTNAMLRRRSSQVAEHSQHMAGRAIDAHFVDVGPARIRDIAMRMQEGGVGFYPTGVTWVHIDSGSVRYWPRMSRDALTRLFPDGKTVFIPADGQPMPGYELAKAEIEARGGEIQTASGGGLFAWLFGARGGGADDAEESGGQEAVAGGDRRRGGGRSGGGGASRSPTPGRRRSRKPSSICRPVPLTRARPSPRRSQRPPPKPAPAPNATEAAPAPQPRGRRGARAAEGRERRRGRIRRSSCTGRSRRSISRRCRRDDRAPANSCSPRSRTFPCRRPGPPISWSRRGRKRSASAARCRRPGPPGLPRRRRPLRSGRRRRPVRPLSRPRSSAAEARGAKALPAGAGADLEQLPKVITAGVAVPPARALALAELPPAPQYDPDALLQRAAELTAPLPPMPIPAAAPRRRRPSQRRAASTDGSRTFPGCGALVSFRSHKPAPADPATGDLRGSQQ